MSYFETYKRFPDINKGAPVYKQIRDGSGNLLEAWTNKGDHIEVWDKDNNLKEQRRRVGDRIEILDGSGNLIWDESVDHY